MGYVTEKRTVKQKTKVLPCVKCGSENIQIGDCGYTSFNVAWGKCDKCGHKVKIDPCESDISKAAIAKVWNKANNPKILKDDDETQIKVLEQKIADLPK